MTFGTPNTKQLSEPSKPCASGISPVIVPPKIGTTLGTNYSLVLKIRTLELFKYITSRPVRHIEEMGYVQDPLDDLLADVSLVIFYAFSLLNRTLLPRFFHCQIRVIYFQLVLRILHLL